MRKVEIKKGFETVFDATTKALKELGIEFKTDKDNKSISASKGFSIFSWGEEIQISFDADGNCTTVKIESISSGQLISWSKNESNEKEIEEAIKKQLKVK